MVIYVDDVLIAAKPEVREGLVNRISKEWKTSTPESVTEDSWVRFAGLELRWKNGNHFRVAHGSYTRDVVERHQISTPRPVPMPRMELPIEEDYVSTEDVRPAQGITGELLWLVVRSRPDLAYSDSVMSRNVARCLK